MAGTNVPMGRPGNPQDILARLLVDFAITVVDDEESGNVVYSLDAPFGGSVAVVEIHLIPKQATELARRTLGAVERLEAGGAS